jgi:hypothetical protein
MSTIGGQGEEVTTNAKEARSPLPLVPTADFLMEMRTLKDYQMYVWYAWQT